MSRSTRSGQPPRSTGYRYGPLTYSVPPLNPEMKRKLDALLSKMKQRLSSSAKRPNNAFIDTIGERIKTILQAYISVSEAVQSGPQSATTSVLAARDSINYARLALSPLPARMATSSVDAAVNIPEYLLALLGGDSSVQIGCEQIDQQLTTLEGFVVSLETKWRLLDRYRQGLLNGDAAISLQKQLAADNKVAVQLDEHVQVCMKKVSSMQAELQGQKKRPRP